MKTSLQTSSTAYPLSLEEIKSHLRIDIGETQHDNTLNALRTVAKNRVEDLTNRKLMKETYFVYFDKWPSGDNYDHFDLPYAPLVSIPSTGVLYRNSTGGSTTISATKWNASTVSLPGRLVLAYNDEWPTGITLDNRDPIRIEFVCGYSSQTTGIPQRYKQAMLLLIGHWFENREATIVGQTVIEIPESVKCLLNSKKVWTF